MLSLTDTTNNQSLSYELNEKKTKELSKQMQASSTINSYKTGPVIV